jgi:hypothetical protein
VLVSELVADDRTVLATIEGSFPPEPLPDVLVPVLVPVAMRERYEGEMDPSSKGGRRTAASTSRAVAPLHPSAR